MIDRIVVTYRFCLIRRQDLSRDAAGDTIFKYPLNQNRLRRIIHLAYGAEPQRLLLNDRLERSRATVVIENRHDRCHARTGPCDRTSPPRLTVDPALRVRERDDREGAIADYIAAIELPNAPENVAEYVREKLLDLIPPAGASD
jgi:hypothetical protein